MRWTIKNIVTVVMLIVPIFMWSSAIWHANVVRFVADNQDVALMALGGGVGMIAGALIISEVTDW